MWKHLNITQKEHFFSEQYGETHFDSFKLELAASIEIAQPLGEPRL